MGRACMPQQVQQQVQCPWHLLTPNTRVLQEADWRARESNVAPQSPIALQSSPKVAYARNTSSSPTCFSLQEADWRARESGILALGAISDGCATGLLPFLEGMLAMLLPRLADARPLVRSITCWALSRYSRWLAHRTGQPGASPQQADAVLQVHLTPWHGVCATLADVQAAAQ